MKAPLACAKCGGSMIEGFLVDQGHGQARVGTWQEGEPKRSIWVGVKQVKKSQLEVTSFRCRRCGYLESYAMES